jgi:hypothetical protein
MRYVQILVPRLTDETHWAESWMSYEAGLIPQKRRGGGLDFFAGDEFLVSFCCHLE